MEKPLEFSIPEPKFPECAYDVGNRVDYAVIWKDFDAHYAPEKAVLLNTIVNKVHNSECSLAANSDRFCISIPTDDYCISDVITFFLHK